MRVLEAVKHLPGQHDQQAHAGRLGGIVPGYNPNRQESMDFISQGADEDKIYQVSEKERADVKAAIQKEIGKRVLKDVAPKQEEKLSALGSGMSLEQYRSLPAEFREKYAKTTAAIGSDKLVGNIMRDWANSSDGDNVRSVALQIAASHEFGVNISGLRKAITSSAKGKALEIWEDATRFHKREGDLNRLVLRKMYEYTQEEFVRAGMKEAQLFRGIASRGKLPNWVGNTDAGQAKLRPISSFSASPRIAREFAYRDSVTKNVPGVVIQGRVPISRILSTARTGLGCLNEFEYTVLGGKTTVNARITRAA